MRFKIKYLQGKNSKGTTINASNIHAAIAKFVGIKKSVFRGGDTNGANSISFSISKTYTGREFCYVITEEKGG